MDIKELVLVLIDKFGGKISSKTKIHKLCYFYSVTYNRDLSYKPHYYGPYSSKVENALDELIGIGLLDINRQNFGVNHQGFEVIRFDYTLNRFSKEVLNKLYKTKENLHLINEIEDFASKLKKAGDPDYFELSIAAKAYYILNKEDKPLTRIAIIEKARKFDWHITEEALNKAIKLLETLNLINIKNHGY